MKLIIAGSRTINPTYVQMLDAIASTGFDRSKGDIIVSGGAKGVDTAAKEFARVEFIEFVEMKADWETHGKAAGPIRNKQMADYSDALLLIWDGTSRGSANMKSQMIKQNKPVYEIIIKKIEGEVECLIEH